MRGPEILDLTVIHVLLLLSPFWLVQSLPLGAREAAQRAVSGGVWAPQPLVVPGKEIAQTDQGRGLIAVGVLLHPSRRRTEDLLRHILTTPPQVLQ